MPSRTAEKGNCRRTTSVRDIISSAWKLGNHKLKYRESAIAPHCSASARPDLGLCCRTVSRTQPPRFQLIEQGIDLLLPIQRLQPSIQVGIQQLVLCLPDCLLTRDFRTHALEGTILTGRRELRLSGPIRRARPPML